MGCDPAGVVATTLPMSSFGEGQPVYGAAFPKMIIHRPPQMSDTGSPRCVFFDNGAVVGTGRWGRVGIALVNGWAGRCLRNSGVGARLNGGQAPEWKAEAPQGHLRLEHCGNQDLGGVVSEIRCGPSMGSCTGQTDPKLILKHASRAQSDTPPLTRNSRPIGVDRGCSAWADTGCSRKCLWMRVAGTVM